MTNYDIVPVNSSLSGVRLYGDSMDPIARGQTRVAERHPVIQGGTPASDSDGLEPGEISLSGTWLGSDATTLADRLRSIFDDPDVDLVDVDAVGETSDIDGRYRLADESLVEQVVPGDDTAYRYQLTLIET